MTVVSITCFIVKVCYAICRYISIVDKNILSRKEWEWDSKNDRESGCWQWWVKYLDAYSVLRSSIWHVLIQVHWFQGVQEIDGMKKDWTWCKFFFCCTHHVTFYKQYIFHLLVHPFSLTSNISLYFYQAMSVNEPVCV